MLFAGARFVFWFLTKGMQTFRPPEPPPVPTNALTLRGEPLRLRGQILTLR